MDSCRYTVQAGASGVRVASGVVGDYSHTHNPSVIGHCIYKRVLQRSNGIQKLPGYRTVRLLVIAGCLGAVLPVDGEAGLAPQINRSKSWIRTLEVRSEERRVGKECRSRW